MTCFKCHTFLQENSLKCPVCKSTVSPFLSVRDLPQADMYGNEIFIFEPDMRKKMLRNSYVFALPEQNSARTTFNESKKHKLFTFLIASAMFFGVYFFSMILPDIGANMFSFLSSLSFVLAIAFVIYRMVTGHWMNAKKMYKYAQIHETKLHYYASKDVVGYSILDHTVKHKYGKTDYYAFYEVSKDNINSISYNTYYAEYVLSLKKPVYMDFGIEPVYEFRIPDVFDDTILSKALSADLPPKTMNF